MPALRQTPEWSAWLQLYNQLAFIATGEGILMLPVWVLKPHLERGELVPLELSPRLQVSTQPGMAIYLLYRKTRYQVPKIRAAVDFLVTEVPLLHS